MPRGGKRPGAGRRKSPQTIEKAVARELAREYIAPYIKELIQAQVSNSLGIKYLVTRDKKSGKFIRVTEAMAKTKLGEHEEIIEVWEKDPSVQAFDSLMNRLLDKPKEQEQALDVKARVEFCWKTEE